MSTPSSSETKDSPWLEPALSCDVVMKGGITSGIVYPGAIVELAKRYRFRNIGGASAGALAAVATAAAEYGRSSPNGGFDRLTKVPLELGGTQGDESGLLRLFVPERSTGRVFDAALGVSRYGLGRGLLHVVRAFWHFPAAAAVLAGLSVGLALAGVVSWVVATIVLAFTPWIACIGLARDAFKAFRRLSENDFGLCRLGPRSRDQHARPLTPWLHDLLQELSGRPTDRPLTFADLWGVELPKSPGDLSEEAREKLERLGWDAREREMDLQVMTTNLTNGRPMRLPVGRDRHENRAEDGGGLLFDPDELAHFFPKEVMDHLIAYSKPPDGDRGEQLRSLAPGNALREFPTWYALPIVVAARMSLSFPVLISVVPLWDIRYQRNAPPQLRRVLFSDGGISSNFPVHFFDATLPRRPTFAINLAGFERGEEPDPNDPATSVVEPVPATGRARETWKDIDTMFSFFVSIKDAMQNWRDNTQARLPGFRERVIHVKLAAGEGGLNLAMKEEKITELSGRGAYAGGKLVELFSGPANLPPQPTPRWDEHRWTRLRVALSALDRLLRNFELAYRELDPGDSVTVPYETRFAAGAEKPYAYEPPTLEFAVETVAGYRELVQHWEEQTLDDPGRPHPVATLRLVPPV